MNRSAGNPYLKDNDMNLHPDSVSFKTTIEYQPGSWRRPIETALRDGTAILIDTDEGVLLATPAISRYDSGDMNCWHGHSGDTRYMYIAANAWQPLPAPLVKD